jgi:YjbE family integral membrane protein
MNPELFSSAWFSALASIIVIDLILAGDNAIVIGLAARNVPAAMQRRVILWGTAGAIIVRALLTAVVVWLLKIPGFLLVGGIALVYIGWKLTRGGEPAQDSVAAKNSVRGAVQTIVVADAVMGVDNVLAVGGAAHGSFALVVIGLAVSIPIVIWGSTLVLKWVERYPAILWLGAGVLGFTAAKMIASEPLLAAGIATRPPLRLLLYAVIVGGLVGAPLFRALPPRHRLQAAALLVLAVWLAGWGWLDERLAAGLDPAGAWQWDESLVDFVRWVGWIPLLIGLQRGLARFAPKASGES